MVAAAVLIFLRPLLPLCFLLEFPGSSAVLAAHARALLVEDLLLLSAAAQGASAPHTASTLSVACLCERNVDRGDTFHTRPYAPEFISGVPRARR